MDNSTVEPTIQSIPIDPFALKNLIVSEEEIQK